MKSKLLAVIPAACLLLFAARAGQQYRLALPGYSYRFPLDHFNHPGYRTEWWYYTGNLHTANGRRFGFELTFFRQALARSGRRTSPWQLDDLYLANFALSDIAGRRFYRAERLNRGGAGLAGSDLSQLRTWNGNWEAVWNFADNPSGRQRLRAVASDFALDLTLDARKPPVIHGRDGVSQKSGGVGRASHYVSFTRLDARGTVDLGGHRFAADGVSWMDHEFFTHQLEAGQTGWDWFSIQLNDNSELMLFRIRSGGGAIDPFSAGTYVDSRGRARHLSAPDFRLAPGRAWVSPATHGTYPVEWRVQVPSLGLDLAVTTPLEDQELTSKSKTSPSYWEGAIDVSGSKSGHGARGQGYLEMTGYAGAIGMGL